MAKKAAAAKNASAATQESSGEIALMKEQINALALELEEEKAQRIEAQERAGELVAKIEAKKHAKPEGKMIVGLQLLNPRERKMVGDSTDYFHHHSQPSEIMRIRECEGGVVEIYYASGIVERLVNAPVALIYKEVN